MSLTSLKSKNEAMDVFGELPKSAWKIPDTIATRQARGGRSGGWMVEKGEPRVWLWIWIALGRPFFGMREHRANSQSEGENNRKSHTRYSADAFSDEPLKKEVGTAVDATTLRRAGLSVGTSPS